MAEKGKAMISIVKGIWYSVKIIVNEEMLGIKFGKSGSI